jgi:hypothetical protein
MPVFQAKRIMDDADTGYSTTGCFEGGAVHDPNKKVHLARTWSAAPT